MGVGAGAVRACLARLQVSDLAGEALVLLRNCSGGGARGGRSCGGAASTPGACAARAASGRPRRAAGGCGPHRSYSSLRCAGCLSACSGSAACAAASAECRAVYRPSSAPSCRRQALLQDRAEGGVGGRCGAPPPPRVTRFSMEGGAPATSTMGRWNSGAIS